MTDEQKFKMYMKLTRSELASMLVEANNMVELIINGLDEWKHDPDLWAFDETAPNNNEEII